MKTMPMDSTGRPLMVGDKVRFRSVVYTIESFEPGTGPRGVATIQFKESQHTDMLASEISVDWVPQETPLGPINSGKGEQK
jgi:hypothetical protein